MSAIRAATIVTVWGAAYLEGAVSADDFLSQVAQTGFTTGVRAADSATAERSGLPGPGAAGTGTAGLLGLLKDGGPPELVLPVPGDLRGLPANSPALVPALDSGAAIVLPRTALAIVPVDGLWRVYSSRAGGTAGFGSDVPPRIAFVPSVLEAELELDSAIGGATKRLMALDIARDSERVRDELADEMRAATVPLPRGTHRRASALLAKVISLQSLLAVAAGYQTGAVSRYELGAIDDALRPLAAAVRSGRLAAVALAGASKADSSRQ